MSVFDDVKDIETLADRGDHAIRDGEARIKWGQAMLRVHAKLRADVEADESKLHEAAEHARVSVTAYDSDIEEPPADPGSPPMPATRRPRADKGTARGPREKASVQTEIPRTSLSYEKQAANGAAHRAILDALKDGPLTSGGLKAQSGLADAIIQEHISSRAIIESFHGQREGDPTPIELIGTPEQAAKFATGGVPRSGAGLGAEEIVRDIPGFGSMSPTEKVNAVMTRYSISDRVVARSLAGDAATILDRDKGAS